MAHDSSPSDSNPTAPQGVELDPDQLSPGALRGLIEEFVTREGTDYGCGQGDGAGSGEGGDRARPARPVEWSLEDKVADVYRQLKSGEARIVFDLESETASIVSTRALGGPAGAIPPAVRSGSR